jgi:ubiquinone/menaquinone biosynthesis C-methylase UbiE
MYNDYYKSDYTPDSARPIVWREIVRYLSRFIPRDATVVDLGAGYCDFINNVSAKTKYAVDISPELQDFTTPNVRKINSEAWNLEQIENESVDVVHASNLFEHFDDEELEKVVKEIKRVLKPEGRLILIQPNFKYSYRSYFDDHTHKKIFTDVSLENFLLSHNFSIIHKKPKFLPYSMKSSPMTMIPFLSKAVWLYLRSPWKPFAGQMLFVSKKDST